MPPPRELYPESEPRVPQPYLFRPQPKIHPPTLPFRRRRAYRQSANARWAYTSRSTQAGKTPKQAFTTPISTRACRCRDTSRTAVPRSS